MNNKFSFELSSMSLHVMAMIFMLCDHLWGTVVPGNDWLTCIGRLAFPIFAFMIVEGYFHTKSLKKYLLRMLLFAVISEIPFNLAMGSRMFYPIHQNVLWSFLISLLLITWNEKTRASTMWKKAAVAIVSVLLGYIVGILTMVDFYSAGVLTVLVFYFFRKRTWWSLVCQIVCLWYINVEMLSGFAYQVEFFGNAHFIVRQGLAMLALVPIWMYKGKQGYHSIWFQYLCYAFYPLHLLILGIIKFVI